MKHNPLILHNIAVSFPHKICFQGLTTEITYGQKIALIGRNGSGKSSLLKVIQGINEPSMGRVTIPANVTFGSVPQIIDGNNSLSGGTRFNKALSAALAANPAILCLDEPTNHLDAKNRRSLLKMLSNFKGTLLVVSHDIELLRGCVTTFWHLNEGTVQEFRGAYDDYMNEYSNSLAKQVDTVQQLKKQKKGLIKAQEVEQRRAHKSKQANAHENDRSLKGVMKDSGSRTTGKRKGALSKIDKAINESLQGLKIPESITPRFSLPAAKNVSQKAIVAISNGSCGYDYPIVEDINMTIHSKDHILLSGPNGSGKSTIVKAILNQVQRFEGEWIVTADSGYLDQHYKNLTPEYTPIEVVEQCTEGWSYEAVRDHLNTFLFRKNEEVSTPIHLLSGGEKARLSLACIAAKTPSLLILDEITNNLDQESRLHVTQVLKEYPGALIIISHDSDFLNSMDFTQEYEITNGRCLPL